MKTNSKTTINKSLFGKIGEREIYLFTLINKAGDVVKVTNYGGIVTEWSSADKNGKRSSIVVGFDSLEKYMPNHPHYGAIVGRYANRIAKGKFKIGDDEYHLATNNGQNHLHGGIENFSKVIWTVNINEDEHSFELTYLSKDGEEGYPGNLSVKVTYSLTDDNALEIKYAAITDKATVINLTNHCYFNLTGDVSNSILDHVVQINAGKYTPVDDQSIPTGTIATVHNTAFDLTRPKKIKESIDKTGGGYDHNYVLDDPSLSTVAATVTEATSGRKLEVFTDQPGLQLYTGNSLNGNEITDKGIPVNKQCALCLETQHFPDSPNRPSFPSTILNPGEQFKSTTIYKLSMQ